MSYTRLIHQSTEFDIKKPNTLYLGIDPTGESLHLGHLLPLTLAKELMDAGWKITILLGGYTGQVGDPSGKNKERKALEVTKVQSNTEKLLNMLHKMLPPSKVTYVNNKDWLVNMNLSEFLKHSKFMSVNQLSKLDTFKNRLQNNLPLSLSEFSYTTLQAIDFLHLHHTEGVNVQIGGQDQWGNISTGVSFVNKQSEVKVQGITTKLLEINGQKIGKTTGHNLSLGQKPLELFINIYNLPDSVIDQLLDMLLNKKSTEDHKENRYIIIKHIFNLINNDHFEIIKEQYIDGMNGKPTEEMIINEEQLSLIDALEKYLQFSRSEIKRNIKNNAIKINNDKINSNKELEKGLNIIRYSKYRMPLYINIQ